METITNIDPKILVALVAAVASLVVALVSAAIAILNLLWGHGNQVALEQVRARLAAGKEEDDARRDYEYEARKRLYEECEPIFFQVIEAAENSMHRVLSLARTSRSGKLGQGEESWLAEDGYYMLSTYYNLFASLALFKLIKNRLTVIDLNVESALKARYDLMKWLFLSWTDDFEFARHEPMIEYTPNSENWRDLRNRLPEQYWRQGIPLGRLDGVAESLLTETGQNPQRLMSFGEFERNYVDRNSEARKMFDIGADVLRGFHPRTRPVLWRILICQAIICNAIVQASRSKVYAAGSGFKPIREFEEAQRNEFDWRETGEDISGHEVNQAFTVARDYLAKRLPELCYWVIPVDRADH